MQYQNRITGSGEEPLNQIMFNPRNWRIHPLHQQDALKGVLEEVGWVQQIIVNKRTGNLIDGHLRCQLAAREGNDTVPVVYVDLSEEEEAMILATLDPIAGMAATDKEKLEKLLEEISSGNENINDLLNTIAKNEGINKDDEIDVPDANLELAEELRVKWGVETGQIWQLGEHRLICGSCTDKQVLERLMGKDTAKLLFTSPPYWVGKSYETQKSIEEIDNFINGVCKVMVEFVSKDESRIVINTGTGFTTSFDKRKKRQVLLLIDKWTNNLFNLGWNLRHVRHWLKHGQLMSTAAKSDLIDQHCEFIACFENDEGNELIVNDNFYDDVQLLETFYCANGINRGQERTGGRWALKAYWDDIHGNANANKHCAGYPAQLVARHILLYTKDGEIVLEPFCGSGTNIVACEALNRKCRAIEISPAYVAVSIQRWVDATGGVPELMS